MMFDVVGVSAGQEEITRAAGAEETIEEHGVTVAQLAQACNTLAPHLIFWQKEHTLIADLQRILEEGYPVGVEWQGLFYESEAEERPGNDYGHFSLVLRIDEHAQTITITDPYKDFVDRDRIFPLDTFMRRWWDINLTPNPVTGEKKKIKDTQLAFFVTETSETFPIELGFSAHQVAGASKPHQRLQNVSTSEQRKKRITQLLAGKLRKLWQKDFGIG